MIQRFDINEDYAHSNMIKAGDFIFFSYCTGNLGENTERQVHGALDEMERYLQSENLDLTALVKVDVLLRDINDIPQMEIAFKKRFNGKYPVRKTIQTVFAHDDSLRAQIDGIAYCGK